MNGKPYGWDEYTMTLDDELLTKPFEEYTLKDAQDIVKSRADKRAATALLFYNGDHWQGGAGWIGPMYPDNHELYQETMAQVERAFISHNVIAEMVDRHVDGVLARELHWAFTVKRELEPIEEEDPITKEKVSRPGQPTAEEQALIQEAQSALVEWWNKRSVLETLKRALAGLLNVQRSPLRLSVPPGLRDEQGNLPAKDLAGCLDYLYLDHMGFDDLTQSQILPTATVWENKNTRQNIGIFCYRVKDVDRAEVSYVNKAGNTVLGILKEEKDTAEIGPFVEMPLAGRILIHEMTRKALTSIQVMSQQKSMNKTLSMKDRNDTQGGYLERFLINVKWPTKKVTKSDGTVVEERIPFVTGPATLNLLQGTTFTDENGVVHDREPKVQFRDPVPATTFIESADHTYLGMLQEGKQLHYAQKDLAVSGESRKQARESYTKDLQNSGNVVEGAVRWVLETSLATASFLAGRAGEFEGLRAYVQAHIDPGPVSADDLRAAAEMKERGMWDWETAVGATGVDDVDAIKQRLLQDQQEENTRMIAFQEREKELGQEEDEEEPERELA